MQRWMFLYRGIIFLNLQSDTCFIDWHASLLERMCSLVIGQQATSQFVVIFSNTFRDFSCIIISSELLLECCHSNTSLHLMKRYDAPIWIFNAACTEELAPTRPPPAQPSCTLNTRKTTVSFINDHKCDGILVTPGTSGGLLWEAVTDWTFQLTRLMMDSTACLVEQPLPCSPLDYNLTTSSL